MKFKFKSIGAAALLALGLASCGGTTTTTPAASTPAAPTTPAGTTTPADTTTGNKVNYYNFDDATVKAVLNGENVSFKTLPQDERAKILGALEEYAVRTGLTGISLFENGGYVMYNPRIKKGTDTYISGYGFGILGEGEITADLEGESNDAWKRYYHTFETEDPGHINYMNDKGSVVGGLVGYVGGSYFDTKMNATKDGYDWIGSLSKDARPVALNASENGTATKFRMEVKVGDELKYNTLSTNPTTAKYKGQGVALEDYVTPFKLLFTQKNGYARGAENLDGSGSIKGTQDYYNASAEGFNAEAWENVGIKAYTEDGKNYLEFEFNEACTPFFAMYYLASSMYAPVPQSFIDEIGGPAAFGASTDSGLTPVDTFLSTGAYVLEAWNKDQEIVFKKNDMMDTGDRYKIAGVHIAILKGQTTDNETALREFLANKLDAVGIPMTQLSTYKDDPRTTTTLGDSVFKLNVNACDQETWAKLFGEEGTICTTPEADYWVCEPALANADFRKALSYAINRDEFAANRGSVASVNYFSSNYLIDPENGISYNATQAHKDAVAQLLNYTENGYSLTMAKAYFQKACAQMIKDGVYKAGDTIEIEICWQAATQVTNYGADIEKYFTEAFNAAETGLNLKINNTYVEVWSDVYYNKMMVGQFDIGFGSISGNTYDPLNFLEVLKSDNSSGFTLNWGTDTSVNDGTLSYDGKTWAFDALWQAADSAAFVVDGEIPTELTDYVATALTKSVHNADGTRTVAYSFAGYVDEVNEESFDLTNTKVVLTYTDAAGKAQTVEVTATIENGVVTFVVPAAVEVACPADLTATFTFDYNTWIPDYEIMENVPGVINFEVTVDVQVLA